MTFHVRIGIFCLLMTCHIPELWAQGLPIRSLPHRIKDRITPDLRVRELVENGQRRLAIIVTVVADQTTPVFNPFGKQPLGRPYRVVLTDSDWNVLNVVVQGSSGIATTPDPKNWLWLKDGGVIGRCHWTHATDDPEERQPEDLAELPVVPMGRYFLVLLVTPRMVHFPLRPNETVEGQQRWRDSWSNPSLDEPCCASLPVVVDVDAQGAYRPVYGEQTDGRFEILETEAVLNSDNRLSLVVRLVNPAESWLVVPSMNLFEPRRRSVHYSVKREDGSAFDPFPYGRGGSYYLVEPKLNSGTLVPRDGVIGGTESYAATLKMPGKYLVTTEIDESIYKDKLFVDGKRVIRKPDEWPIVFRSRTTTIPVPEKAP